MAATRTRTKATALPDGLLGAWLASKPKVLDETKLAPLIGGWTVDTQNAVARVFGVSPNTIKQSWMSAGMPGRQGRWNVLDIFAWRVRHEQAIDAKRSQSPTPTDAETRQAMADARKTELQVEKLELEMAETAGRLIDREIAGTAFRSILSELAEAASTIGDEMETEFPIDVAKEKAATINRKFTRLLNSAAEKGARVIPQVRTA